MSWLGKRLRCIRSKDEYPDWRRIVIIDGVVDLRTVRNDSQHVSLSTKIYKIARFRNARTHIHFAVFAYRDVHKEVYIRDDVFGPHPIFLQLAKKVITAVWLISNAIAKRIEGSAATTTDRVMFAAGIRYDRKQRR